MGEIEWMTSWDSLTDMMNGRGGVDGEVEGKAGNIHPER